MLDVIRNATNKIAVALGADEPEVTDGVQLFVTDADGLPDHCLSRSRTTSRIALAPWGSSTRLDRAQRKRSFLGFPVATFFKFIDDQGPTWRRSSPSTR